MELFYASFMTALTAEALRLSPQERLELIQEVWQSLSANPDSLQTSAEDIAELERRRSRYLSDPESLVDWNELKARIRQRRPHAH